MKQRPHIDELVRELRALMRKQRKRRGKRLLLAAWLIPGVPPL